MTLDELRDAAAQMLGFPDFASARPDQSWISRAVVRAVYKAFQPTDDTRAKWAEETFGIFLPAPQTINLDLTQGSSSFSVPISQPNALVVEGAGTEAANGIYLIDNSYSAPQAFQYGVPEPHWISYFEVQWFLFATQGGSSPQSVYVNPLLDFSSPPDGWVTDIPIEGWREDDPVMFTNPSGASPAPQIRQATWQDIDDAGIDRNSVSVIDLAPQSLPSEDFRGSYVLIDGQF